MNHNHTDNNHQPTRNRYIAICPDEHKDVLCTELDELGAEDVVADFRAVYFSADLATFYAAHLKLRTASALLRIIKVIRMPTEDNIYRQCLRIKWQEILAANLTFRVDGIDADRSGSGLPAQVVSKKIRLAICAYCQRHGLPKPRVDLDNPHIVISGYNQQHKCIISINTSGMSMHKRGFRGGSAAAHPAPLKETLAASILLKIGYHGQKPLLDVMCGSGTIAIEAALIALKHAPLALRSNNQFAFTHHRDFSNSVWRTVQE
ncbi:MAG: THUMP domain-containing protein, partial [Pseudomonadota bacterium]|nr:THUMP domain-containing protein [Pseudomonadota bacterium]